MISYVLDSSAFLAYLWKEPGWERIETIITAGHDVAISAVNVSEVIAKAIDRGLPAGHAGTLLASLDVEQVDFGSALALQTALLRPLTRQLGLSLGDRACLALAMSRDATVLTADQPWVDLDIGVRIECIR